MKYVFDIGVILLCLVLIGLFLPYWTLKPSYNPMVHDNNLNVTYNCTQLIAGTENVPANTETSFNYTYYEEQNPLSTCKALMQIDEGNTAPVHKYQYAIIILAITAFGFTISLARSIYLDRRKKSNLKPG